MDTVSFSLLRGVCQTPAYVAQDRGFFAEAGIDARIDVAPTAWVVPQRIAAGELDFAVIPWTRVAAAKSHGEDMVAICGSGVEEAALVVRPDVDLADVKTVALNQVESLWPVHGSVLILDGVAYCSAGRSTWLDGGIWLWGLDSATGKIALRSVRNIHYDLQMSEFNGEAPLPREIRLLLEQR